MTLEIKMTLKRLFTVTLLAVLSMGSQADDITSLDELSGITGDGSYVITQDIDASGYTSISSFSGTLEAAINPETHMPYRITNLSAPLFTTLTGTVKNLVLENVSISSGDSNGNTGAIACKASGSARIYNVGILSGSVSGSGNVGGLVGLLDGSTADDKPRVINCYNFANITGGTKKAGIVGHNSYASKTGDIKTMVMNCMFYGNISYSGTTDNSIYPIYGGSKISNEDDSKLNNYNYFLYEADFSKGKHIPDANYNCALAAEERYLVRFEFYRNLLNSTRELASWYVYGSVQSDAHQKMLKWVLDKSIAKYPVLKEQGTYPSPVNYDPEYTNDESGAKVSRASITERNKGKNLGTLTVNITIGSGYPTGASIKEGKSSITLQRTDKDEDNYNFNYDKVQLPYYNEVGTGNCTKNKVVTGWKITAMGGGTQGTFTAADQWDGYNFADRSTYAKDLFSVSGRVFSQGAYFDVPDGVTSIDIEPYWGKAAYLSDTNYDSYGYNTSQGVADFGTHYENNTKYNICGDQQKVYTSFSNALSQLSADGTVYDNVIVLVGNYHQKDRPSEGTKAFTIMSIDQNEDNEPDYCFIYNSGKQQKLSPIRFDFVNVPGTAMAHKKTSTTYMGIMGNHKWLGWLEVTNTATIRFSQLEYDNEFKKDGLYPVILLGGVVEQMVSTNGGEGSVQNTKYIHVGSNVWFKMFNNGCHMDKKSTKTPRIPISVTGGDYEKFYLSGYFQPEAPSNSKDDAECYISGGRFGELAGSGQEKIDGNVQWLIDRADISNFYGGGINEKKPITGDITVTIKNSHVGTYCGGPKFGNMATNKTVITTATGCTFDTYFGAGYGGTALVRVNYYNKFDQLNYPWNTSIVTTFTTGSGKNNKRGRYDSSNGIAVNYEYEQFEGSNDKTVGRFYVNYASLSLAETNNVTSTLTGCTIKDNFYGGGSLGKVNGNVTSTLTDCTVNGNVYGAGFSGEPPTVNIYPASGFTTEPSYNSNTGVFQTGVPPTAVEYTWSNASGLSTSKTLDETKHLIYTDIDLGSLGTVTGKVTLNIDGTTRVDGTSENVEDGGNVYGGGESSDATGDVEVNINAGTISKDVYGGGKGQTTVVGGNVTVNIGTKTGEGSSATYSGTGTMRNVYGGSAMGAVNATKNSSTSALSFTEGKTTNVNIYGGTITGSVFGGGLGQTTPDNIAAQNFGNTTVTVEKGTVNTAVYGGSNANGVLKKDATVTIIGGTVGTAPTNSDPIGNAVFGGGFGEPTLVEGNVLVNIGTSGQSTTGATINGHVYGGGALGSVNTSKPENSLVFNATQKVDVNLYKGTINGDAYGGGLGQKNGVNGASSNIESFVGGDVNVLLDGAKITGSIFGCNNLNGTPKGHVKVHVKQTIGSDKPTEDGTEAHNPITRDQRTTYDVAAVYGGGNQADYIPTDATLDPNVEGNSTKIAAARAEVIIEGCDQTSIEYVYGGGNAAAVPATDVTILGDYIINYVFGGGNGAGTGNPGADVGIKNRAEYAANPTTGIYGTGKAVTKLVGGHINYVFGGSNTKGNVRGGTTMTMPEKDTYDGYNCCDVRDIKEIYGAGNQAEQDGAVTLILGCVDNMDYVYGGARNAHVKGGVDLVVTSGHFKGVFGGNDTSGSIQGPITLTIEETGCDPLIIDELYLGGKDAAYSVYGYKKDGDNLVARTKAEYDALTTEQKTAEGLPYANPVLNVVSCTRIGNLSGDDLGGVFGGGKGSGATMYGSPTVNINMIPGKYANQIDRDGTAGADGDATALGTIVNVYGGGNAADVVGDTHVNICTEETVTERSSMGAPITGTPQTVLPAYITGDVFGAGKGDADHVEYAMVSGNTTIVMGAGEVKQSVYGGGELSQVTGDTHITVNGGSIGDSTGANAGETYGNIYGGGKGNTTNALAGRIQGNTNITIQNIYADAAYAAAHSVEEGSLVSSPSIYHNIYGGGAHGSVGSFTYDGSTGLPTGLETGKESTGKATINVTGGEIGINGHENGMIFGSSRGDVDRPGTIYDKVAWVYDTEVNIGTENDATAGPIIHGSLYGSGENGHTLHNASVTMHSGTIGNPSEHYQFRGNVYGGGCGTDMYYADPNDETHDGNGTLYNPLAGIVKGTATVLIDGASKVARNVYGAGAMGSVEGSTSVTIGGNAIIGVDGNKEGEDENGYVYAAARGKEGQPTMATVGSSSLTISGASTIKGSAFGGGQNGYVLGAVAVVLNGGTVKHDVYGGGALAQTNTEYNANDDTKKTYTTNVTLAGATINGNLYGGGLGEYSDDSNETNDIAADVNGPVKVVVTSGSADNVFGCNNIYGAPKSTVEVEIGAKTVEASNTTYSGTGTISGSVYGGGKDAAYTGNPTVKIYSGTVNTNVYGGGLGSTAIVTGNTAVTMEGGTVKNDVYGGGSQADVTGDVNVNVSGGKVINNVYGGGALANTNTGNWTLGSNTIYIQVSDNELSTGKTSVTGLYIKDGNNYVEVTDENAKAADGITYYDRRDLPGDWKSDMNNQSTGTTYKTTVTLTGGVIGNAYGGGLGAESTPVYVFGDVAVYVNRPSDISDNGGSGVAFTHRTERVTIGSKTYPAVPITGNVFGCNNINGTPLGNVTVEVYSTRQIDGEGNYVSGHGPNDVNGYDIQAVYGGGNQASYVPAEGKKTMLNIYGCDESSISNVYGGGSSASVPASDVTIWGNYDISYAFGGGNGSLPVKKGTVWQENDGASVIGLAKITCHGGKFGEIFGGSDAKGDCRSTSSTQQQEGDCPLHITKLFGAGKETNVDGNVNVVISACTGGNSEIEYVCGGSYKARVSGDVILTITSGYFKNVYGGNDQRGGIGGNIIVNIEETDPCAKPIIIQNLVGGGNQADYPGTKDDNGTPYEEKSRKITVNVKSATRIDNVFGGCYKAVANANTEVNINMVKGNKSGHTEVPLPSYYGEPNAIVPSNITVTRTDGYVQVYGLVTEADAQSDPSKTASSVVGYYTYDGNKYTAATGYAQSGTTYYEKSVIGNIADAIGTIGNVYGGGNQGLVYGSTTVNIGTATSVDIMKRNSSGELVDNDNNSIYDAQGKITEIYYTPQDVLGANILGDVFGGGKEADVTGDTHVNICTELSSTPPTDFEGFSIGGSIYGGGSIADVLGNTNVTMSGGYVYNGIFGGGLEGSVGTFTRDYTKKTDEGTDIEFDHSKHTCLGKPTECTSGGTCTVVVNGGQIGPVEVATEGMKRMTNGHGDPVPEGWVWGGGCGLVEDPADDPDTHFKAYVNKTDVTISGTAFILESVIGGGEFGRVLSDTHVTIEGNCQIGVGADQADNGKPIRYTDEQWSAAATAVTTGTASDINAAAATMPECSHYDYGFDHDGDGKKEYWPYDPYYDETKYATTHVGPASTDHPSDGQTWIGLVFGGGSGYMPYEKANGKGYDWCRSAGLVEGNTLVEIKGGHILTNVYGGNEYTDVKGKCTVKMIGGTIGVPRTKQQIIDHPLTCSLFGSGKGDQRDYFNEWTNVGSVEIEVSGGIIYGSVYGGGEEAHVLGDVQVDIKPGAWIGTWGTSDVDGDVYGGGRGFSGETLTAGSVGGNVKMNITGGTMLGNIYGGGELASVGIGFTDSDDHAYGQLTDDKDGKKYGYVDINISGGTIGTTTETGSNHPINGNVFGGSMGRTTLLNGDINPLWPKLAVAKETTINISGSTTNIMNNVYGGGEYGVVRDKATVTINSGTINGHVYGGGFGSDDNKEEDRTTITAAGYESTGLIYTFTPAQWTGCVSGDTYVNISGGRVKKNVYGGGELASVGLIDFSSDKDGNYKNIYKHADIEDIGTTSEKVYGFGLSWPYEFTYIAHNPKSDHIGGKATVTVTDGRIEGYVFGGSKGKADERYKEAEMANVRETEVKINYGSTPTSDDGSTTACIAQSVYGGGEDGHVYENAAVNITGGLIGVSVYGGGKGEGTYEGKLRSRTSPYDWNNDPVQLSSWTAGKVYGNTSVNMSGGHVMVNIYGGGNRASVGKGNYAGGTDDYYKAGYGETLANEKLWESSSGFNPANPISGTNKPDFAWHFLNSGKSTVTITGGTVGTPNTVFGTVDNLTQGTPTGMVFGGSRGKAAEDIGALSPRYAFAPDFYLGYVNNTEVTIGTRDAATGPTIYSQVFGGGRDGHVRGSTHVTIYKGTIGQLYDEYDNAASGIDKESQRRNCGNVYGSGSGMGTWDAAGQYHGTSSGSVTRNTTVDIYGGTIYGNVYGGGANSSVGPPQIPPSAQPADKTWSLCKVNIYGGNIGGGKEYESVYQTDYDKYGYGGCVFGASRGGDFFGEEKPDDYATTLWNEVNISGGTIAGNVYGGGQASRVKKDNVVNLTGGTIAHDAYGGGKGTSTIIADVGGNTTVELNKGVADNEKGCIVERIFGCNDLSGTPKGDATVRVFATQHKDKGNISQKVGPVYSPSLAQDENETSAQYLQRLIDMAKHNDTVLDGITASVITAAEGALNADNTTISTHAKNVIAELEKTHDYDVKAVYGGGNLAAYEPYGPAADNTPADYKATKKKTIVVIEGCAETSIKQVYGGGNAAPVPASDVSVRSCFIIDELFGGGNGAENYTLKEGNSVKWYENPGANVGYYTFEHHDTSGSHGTGADEAHKYEAITNTDPDASTPESRKANYAYGDGTATTTVTGGHMHYVYGGSNMKGNIRAEVLSQFEESGSCTMITDETYGGSKSATIDAQTNTVLNCVENGGTYYGGSYNADINNDVNIIITNGHYDKIFGGNNKAGTISGRITIDIEERGCTPITIDELYGGGYLAPYSVYGYKTETETAKDENGNILYVLDSNGNPTNTAVQQRIPYKPGETGASTTPSRDPYINIISATEIKNIYGGGYKALMIGSPHINVNMTTGRIREAFKDKDPSYASLEEDADNNKILPIGTIGNIFGGGNMADVLGNTYVNIGTGEWLNKDGERETTDADGKIYTYNTTTQKWDWVIKNDEVVTESGTVDDKPTPSRNAAVITGNVYGGGKMGHVGYFSTTTGKPTSCATGTGKCYITISNGEIGPDDMSMYHLNNTGNIPADDNPDNAGHVFGGGQGTNLPADANKAFVDYTNITIDGTAWVKGSVFGGGENGHVLHDTQVNIDGNSQIGNGHILRTDGEGKILYNRGVNRPYTAAEWAAGHLFVEGDPDIPTPLSATETALRTAAGTQFANSLPECDSWLYGKTISNNKVVSSSSHAPHDIFAGSSGYTTVEGGSRVASDGRAFNGSVYGGGSGYFPYEAGKWLDTAGQVEGDAYVNVTGGHILTSLYGGCEMTSVKGDTHVSMSGGTLGVPRTLDEIAAHPMTCYVFGGGKGEGRSLLDNTTNVRNANVTISGGWVYGSVFGGAEDGHVLGNATVNIQGNAVESTTTYADIFEGRATKIGTLGTSYVDGNIFGGGRGYDGSNAIAGSVSGSIAVNIEGGTMLGSVYGGGRLGSVGIETTGANAGKMKEDVADNTSTTDVDETANYGHITINISGGTIGNDEEYVYNPSADAINKTTGSLRYTTFEDLTFKPKKAVEGSTTTVDEETEKVTVNRLYHPKGGNVFAGGMGRLTLLDGTINPKWDKLGLAKQTSLTISDNAIIKGSVYGGAEFGQVTGNTTINFTGGTIGTEILKDDVPQYTIGSIFGGGMGDLTEVEAGVADPKELAGYVAGNTTVNMSTGKVKASVYGGGKLAQVGGNTSVTVSGGEIGLNVVRKDDGYVMFGSAAMGNVFGAGAGNLSHTKAGLVKGNTYVTINAGTTTGEPFIYHNVYGGGALASVGDFHLIGDKTDDPTYIPRGVPFGWKDGTGTATVTIKGGTIGISGRDNGMVNGSSRGDIEAPTNGIDPYDKVAWVNHSIVNIGETGQAGPKIKGSVYGGGENGHNSGNSTVNVYSGSIGVIDVEDPWLDFGNTAINEKAQATRGNVYGAGCGTDTYTVKKDGKEYEFHNPKAGMVGGNSEINISGGIIAQNVYGGGSIGSVGTIINVADTASTAKHSDENNGFALSWPYELKFKEGTGKATINITGGHIGAQVEGTGNIKFTGEGDVYGSTRGEVGDRYATAHLAYVRETEVNVTYDATAKESDLKTLTTACITGSVHGSGRDGYVYGDTKVTLNKGLIGHSLYGGGKGAGTYKQKLLKIGATDGSTNPDDYYEANIYSLIAGKVMGNTHVIMNDGHVLRNVYGGGNIASVGKGNYACGADDYYPNGYGEKLTGNLWTTTATAANPDNAWHFLNSGKTTVEVKGGKVGYIDKEEPSNSFKEGLPYGNVIGGSRGEAAPNINEEIALYLYCPAFFSGYVNETDVVIGKPAEGTVGQEGYVAASGPEILGSVYGGGQDGHVRRDTHVTVYAGEIGLPFNDENRAIFNPNEEKTLNEELDDPQWLYRGNVYGAGSGISKYEYDFNYNGKTSEDGIPETSTYNNESVLEEDYSTSAGSVTHFTEVDVKGGTIHRNVYGGGSLATVGPPYLGQGYDPYKKGDEANDANHGLGKQSMCTVTIGGGTGTVSIGTQTDYQAHYGGEVYGASRGVTNLDPNQYSSVVWTLVKILNGANIQGNVFGGGDAGTVKKDSEVIIGDPAN